MKNTPIILVNEPNKCVIQTDNGTLILYSYQVPVAMWKRGKGNCLLPEWENNKASVKHVVNFFGYDSADYLRNLIKEGTIKIEKEIN